MGEMSRVHDIQGKDPWKSVYLIIKMGFSLGCLCLSGFYLASFIPDKPPVIIASQVIGTLVIFLIIGVVIAIHLRLKISITDPLGDGLFGMFKHRG
jgi:hypothetical protein